MFLLLSMLSLRRSAIAKCAAAYVIALVVNPLTALSDDMCPTVRAVDRPGGEPLSPLVLRI